MKRPPPIYEQRLFPYLLRVHVVRVLSLTCCACTFLLCTCCMLPMPCIVLTPGCPYFHHTITFYPPRVRIKVCVHVCM